MSKEMIEPCPFCGERPVGPTFLGDEDGGYFYVECPNNGRDDGHFAGVHASTEAEAIAAWNKRAAYNPNERLREAEKIEQVCKDMEYAIAGGMSWISHDECVHFVRQLRKIGSALSPLPQGED